VTKLDRPEEHCAIKCFMTVLLAKYFIVIK